MTHLKFHTACIKLKTVGGLNAREHWRKRSHRVRNERTTAKLAAEKLERPFPCTVTLTRLSSGTLDSDNLQGAFKAVRDGVADAYKLADNDPGFTWKYAQEKCKRGDFGIRIEID